jgi:hypothetical protein
MGGGGLGTGRLNVNVSRLAHLVNLPATLVGETERQGDEGTDR